MKHLSKPWILTTTLILTTPLLFGCSDTNIEEIADEAIRPAKIATVVSAAGSVQRSFPAQVSANASTSLAFRVPGQITKCYVTEGKRVEAGLSLLSSILPTSTSTLMTLVPNTNSPWLSMSVTPPWSLKDSQHRPSLIPLAPRC